MTAEPPSLPPSHWVRPLQTVTVAPRHVFVDTEAWRESDPDDPAIERQTFRLGVVQIWDVGEQPEEMAYFYSASELWYYVSSVCRVRKQTVLWAHNLSYDIRLSNAFDELAKLNWSFELFRVDTDLAWAEVVRSDGAKLIMCDSLSWLPMSLDKIGRMMNIHKPGLPDDITSVSELLDRCIADVSILSRAVRHIIGWLMADDVAPLKRTGTASGFAAFRHRYLRHKLLVHNDLERRNAERHAAYCGRCEPWQIGEHHNVYEWDFAHAYAGICRDYLLPVRPHESCHEEECEHVVEWLNYGTLTVQHNAVYPAAPYRADMESPIVWPVGTFRGWWWNKEVPAECISEITSRYQYVMEPVLMDWALWIIDLIDHHPSPIIAAVAKQWARTTIGRFGLRYPVWQAAEQVDGVDLFAGWWLDGDNDVAAKRMMRLVDRMYIADRMVEGHDSMPQIMSYVMMLTRRRLERMIRIAGYDNVLYMDTDGLLANREGNDRLLEHRRLGTSWESKEFRPKSVYDTVHVLGPKQLVLDGTPRVAGLPSRARKRNKDGSYSVEVFETFRGALETGHLDGVTVTRRNWRAAPAPMGRRRPDHGGRGMTLPPVV